MDNPKDKAKKIFDTHNVGDNPCWNCFWNGSIVIDVCSKIGNYRKEYWDQVSDHYKTLLNEAGYTFKAVGERWKAERLRPKV